MNRMENLNDKVCDLRYLVELMGGKKNLVMGIMDSFLTQIPEELKSISDAIATNDYRTIKNFSHTMKSSVSIMGISTLTPILAEMEVLGEKADEMQRIMELNSELTLICNRAMEEIKAEKYKYNGA